MSFEKVLTWINQKFCYPVPEDYLNFLKNEDFSSTLRKFYVINEDSILEISEWFTCENIFEIYNNCYSENMIEKYYLPIFDSCGCTIVLNCNYESEFYGQIFMRTPTGYYDEDLQENIYEPLDFVANSFSKIINNLKSSEELEEMGIF